MLRVVAAHVDVTDDGQPCVVVTVVGDEPKQLLTRVMSRLDGRAISAAHDVGREDERAAIAAFLDARDLTAAAELVRSGTYPKESHDG